MIQWMMGGLTIAGLLAVGGLLESEWEKKQLRIHPYEIESEKLPKAFDGMKVAVLADLHACSFGVQNEKILEKLREIKPDLVIGAGDMILKTRPDEVEEVVSFLERVGKEIPTYYGTGNHEIWLKNVILSDGTNAFDSLKKKLEEAGVLLLSDETREISRGKENILLTGLDLDLNHYGKGRHVPMEEEYLERKLGPKRTECFRILVGHYPDYFPEYQEWGADLVLAGHIHGGTVRLPFVGGLMSPNYLFFPKYDRGLFRRGKSFMVVSGGLGTHSIKIRFGGNFPEIPVITLKRKNYGD